MENEVTMNFGQAIEALKQGKKVQRQGWNGKGMYLFLRQGRTLIADELSAIPTGTKFESLPHICMWTAQQNLCVGWLASQTDMLAEDWQEV